jgi:hypothetical protein
LKASKVTDESRRISQTILRKQYYFLAQALLENKDTIKAVKTLNYAFTTLPNKTIPFGEYAFSYGKLLYRINHKQEGDKVFLTAINNIEEKIKWMTSFNAPRAIINQKYVNTLHRNYKQMVKHLFI